MPTPVELPKLGNTVEECLIARWLKHPGELVAADETVLEIETDKAVQEIASPVAGTLLATFFAEGEFAPVFTNVFVVGNPGEDVESFRPSSATNPVVVSPAPAVQIPEAVSVAAGDDTIGTGPLSPRARRYAAEHNFHPAQIQGSGPAGRVLEGDLRRLYESTPHDPISPTTAEALPRIRAVIAQRMRESLRTTAQYTLHTSANATGLLTLRRTFKGSPTKPDATINDMILFCTVRALLEVPELNVEFLDDKLVRHADVHLGMAVDTPRGLMVPVLHNAHTLSLGELVRRTKELSAQTVQGTISPDDLSGATFTVTNLGSLGIESFTPILNPPQVAILGVDAIQLKPIHRAIEPLGEPGAVAKVQFIDAIGLSLTLDHQIIDGAPGARFLKVLRDKVENIETLIKDAA